VLSRPLFAAAHTCCFEASLDRSEAPHRAVTVTQAWSSSDRSRGGDRLDTFEDDDGAVYLVVLDPVGRGAKAEALGDFVSDAIHELLRQGDPPRTALRCVNDVLLDKRGGDQPSLATAAIAVLDRGRRTVAFASAGHVEGFRFLPDGRHAHYSSTGPMLGVLQNAEYALSSFSYLPGESFVLVTDGLLDVRPQGKRAFLGTAGLCRIIHGHLASSGETCAGRIVADVRRHAGGALADDAVALVAKL
jgi:serine phosphatase RsbU (regulator of sigma subunit)